jgi:valyl-tRNA synthetase
MINVMTPDGRINEQGGPFEGMNDLWRGKAVIEALQEKG